LLFALHILSPCSDSFWHASNKNAHFWLAKRKKKYIKIQKKDATGGKNAFKNEIETETSLQRGQAASVFGSASCRGKSINLWHIFTARVAVAVVAGDNRCASSSHKHET